MKEYIKFIRFVINIKGHERGEKIKSVQRITKVFEDGEFQYIMKPYIFASDKQIEYDLEGTDYSQYLPLRNFKYDYNTKTIVKKDDNEIKEIELMIEKKKIKNKEDKENYNNMLSSLNSDTLSDKEKLDKIIKIIQDKFHG